MSDPGTPRHARHRDGEDDGEGGHGGGDDHGGDDHGGGDGGDHPDSDRAREHQVLGRLIAEGAEDIAAFGRRLAATAAVTAEEEALLGWVLLRVEQIVEQILDDLR